MYVFIFRFEWCSMGYSKIEDDGYGGNKFFDKKTSFVKRKWCLDCNRFFSRFVGLIAWLS